MKNRLLSAYHKLYAVRGSHTPRASGKAATQKFLNDWMKRAEASGMTLPKKFAHTLAARKSGILAWYDDRISTGPLKGTINKIKTMKRQAYGFRDTEFLKLKTMALQEAK